jgi:exosortase A-associated hydrolase 1
MNYTEQGTVFRSNENRLVGIAAVPDDSASVGVLILVGGPQYRVGSHRQFTRLARDLAASGIPCFRFDYAGMGDSEGDKQEFHEVEDDITAALDRFQAMVPELSRVVIWGLCDAASLALMVAYREPRICSLVLVNPWVHLGDYSPEVKLSHYYAPLLRGGETWRRFFTGKIEILPALKEFLDDGARFLRQVLGMHPGVPLRHRFVAEMLEGLQRFKGQSFFILSEQDLTAREFHTLVSSDQRWQKAVSADTVEVHQVPEADHTFSKKTWQDEMSRLTLEWVKKTAQGA